VGAVEGEHELAVQTLAVRVLLGERLERGDGSRVAAELQLDLEALLERREPLLFEPVGLDGRRSVQRRVGQRRPAEELDRLVEQLRLPVGLVVRARTRE
jgi:hypothetical protein